MPEPTRPTPLRDPQIARAAAASATPPDLDGLRRRGRRRRNVRTVAAVGAAAVAVAVIGVGLEATDLTTTGPAPSPPVASVPSDPQPTEADDSAPAWLAGKAANPAFAWVDPDDPDRTAVQWRCIDIDVCPRDDEVLVVTDGEDLHHVLPADLPVENARRFGVVVGGTDGVVAQVRGSMVAVDFDGDARPVDLTDDAGPLTDGEVPIPRDPGVWYAVDAATGSGHLLSTPDGADAIRLEPTGRLLATLDDARAATSTDGGATWDVAGLPVQPGDDLTLIAASSGDDLAIFVGGDGATVFPFAGVLRSRDDGATWERVPGPADPAGYLGGGGGGAVLPDGRLVVAIQSWSDQPRLNRPGSRPVGLYVSDGDDWATLKPVAMIPPVAGDLTAEILQLTGSGQVTASSSAVGGLALWTSPDAGRNWSRVDAR